MKGNFLYKIIRPFFTLYLNFLYKPIVIGKENIPNNGCILIANHKNNLDFISMGIVTNKSVHFLAKSSLFRGILKPILTGCGIIPVNRNIKDKTVIPKCIELLNEDRIIGMFPEGTFNKTDDLIAPFKIGAVKIAYETKKPIIPIVIGEYKKNMKIIVCKPVYILNDDLTFENAKLMEYMKKVIMINGE